MCGWRGREDPELADELPKDEIPHEHAVRQAHVTALRMGAWKHTNLFVYGPRNAGKSFSLDGIAGVCQDFASSVLLENRISHWRISSEEDWKWYSQARIDVFDPDCRWRESPQRQGHLRTLGWTNHMRWQLPQLKTLRPWWRRQHGAEANQIACLKPISGSAVQIPMDISSSVSRHVFEPKDNAAGEQLLHKVMVISAFLVHKTWGPILMTSPTIPGSTNKTAQNPRSSRCWCRPRLQKVRQKGDVMKKPSQRSQEPRKKVIRFMVAPFAKKDQTGIPRHQKEPMQQE